MSKREPSWKKKQSKSNDWRIEAFRICVLLFACAIGIRLIILQVIDHGFYEAVASGQHEIFQELNPERGSIYIHDLKDEKLVPIATNQRLAFVYADPRHIDRADDTAEALAEIFDYDIDKIEALEKRLDQKDDPYEPIEREVSDELLAKLLELDLPGINYVREETRIYPEPFMSGHVIGFLGSNEDGSKSGKYGLEGYFNKLLAGTTGFIQSERDIAGRLIAVAERSIEPAVDGVDLVLTLDRTIQYKACSTLEKSVKKHGADSGSVIIMEPHSGKILAMCGAPDFDPNTYFEIDDINSFNNPAIFDAYEPGSIFKPITMAAALDVEAVTPTTQFKDTGSVMVDGWPKPLGNAEGKSYGLVDMTKVLEESINTGMIFSMRQMGTDVFKEYVSKFGFGKKTEIELEKELTGDVSSLENESEIYSATATFGQGITTTPIQIVSAFAAIANGGVLKRPYIVEEVRHSDGTIEKTSSKDIAQVIDSKTSRLLGAMLVSVIERGHGRRAGVDGYYIAGKTGTAQVPKKDGIGYSEDYTIGSFVGFGPVENPKFAMIVRIDNPKDVIWAESTAAPLFGDLAEFLLQYFEIPPVRNLE